MHLADMLDLFGTLLSMATQERRHKIVKAFIVDHKNTKSFERGLIEEITVEHVQDLVENDLKEAGLRDATEASEQQSIRFREHFPYARYILSSRVAVAANQTFTVNDVALARIDGELMPCRILAHCQADDDMPFTFVNRWCVEDRSDKYCMIARRAEDVKLLATKDLLSSVIYRLMSDPSFVAILVPASLRT